jgi:Flp pilus assembly protein TadD
MSPTFATSSILTPAIVAAVTFVVFLPALRNGFVAWDDDKTFLANPHYRGLGRDELRWMWSTFHLGHYVPLSWMTLGFDYVLWGMNPLGYHLTNVVIHCGNAALLYFLALWINRTVGIADAASARLGAIIAALFFAIHPLRVESVAWITERRDVLSGFFYLATILLYLRAIEQPERFRRWYGLALVAFVCALLSKATSVTVPAVLLLLNVYPLRRLSRATTAGKAGWFRSRAIRELVPFVALAGAAAVLSIVALHPPAQLNTAQKVAVSGYGLVFYLWKTILPIELSPVYEMPQRVDPGGARFVASYILLLAVGVCLWMVRRRLPGLVAAVIAFFVIVFPLLGIVQNGPQIAADRYTYHAAPALAVLLGAAMARQPRRIAAAAGTLILLILATVTWNQARVWHDTKTLWSRVLEVDEESSVGHVGMANVLFKENRTAEALEHARRAVAIAPTYAQARNDLGVGLAKAGQIDGAIDEYRRALALEPNNDDARSNLGVVLASRGDLDGAIEQYRLALQSNPDNADAHVNWGNALVRLSRADEAIDHYRTALIIRPDDADAEHNWGVALARSRRFAEAIEHFRRALALDPSHAEAREYLDQATRLLRGGGA